MRPAPFAAKLQPRPLAKTQARSQNLGAARELALAGRAVPGPNGHVPGLGALPHVLGAWDGGWRSGGVGRRAEGGAWGAGEGRGVREVALGGPGREPFFRIKLGLPSGAPFGAR